MAELVNRWSFNNPAGAASDGLVMIDSVSGAVATVEGNFSSFNGSGLSLSGSTTGNRSAGFISGYVNLPNGIISSKTDLTVEIWASPDGFGNFSRVFDFGRVAGNGFGSTVSGEIVDLQGNGQTPGNRAGEDSLFLSFCRDANISQQRMDAFVGNANSVALNTDLPTTQGTIYHYAMTYQSGLGAFGANGGRVTFYRNSNVIHAADVNFTLSQLEDVNNWLGRSQWTGDRNADATYYEFRLHDHAMSPAEITASLAAGPDQLPVDPVDPPTPDHLWIFNEQADSELESGSTFADSVGGMIATARGQGASLTGTSLVLPGASTGNQALGNLSAYLDLPNGSVTATPSVTFEAWVTPLSSRNWQRLFDFGRCTQTSGPSAASGEIVDSSTPPGNTDAWDNLSLTLNNGADINTQQLEGEINNGGPIFTTSTANTVPGTRYHYVFRVEDGVGEFGASGCRVSWYRNGVLQNSDDFAFRLTDFEDVNNWIGRSMYTGDSNSHLSLDELRIYRRAITPAEIQASFAAGPDPGSGPPEPPAPLPVPALRWSFNNAASPAADGLAFLDATGRETATLRGQGGSLDGARLVLPGTTTGNQSAATISAYLDFSNGFVSTRPSMTLEAWVTPLSSKNWQRLWDFGNCSITSGAGASNGEIIDGPAAPGVSQAADNLFLSLNLGGVLGSHRLGGRWNLGDEIRNDADLAALTVAGTEYHFAMSVADGAGSSGSSGSLVKWYRDGQLIGSIDLPWRMTDLEDVNNWIGRSNWSADSNSHIALNELRLHDHALNVREIAASRDAGPDAAYPAPQGVMDAASLHRGQKVKVDVLRNDIGGFIPETLEIVSPPANGTAVVTSDRNILYAHNGSIAMSDSFSYRVNGLGGWSAAATVEISVEDELRIDSQGFQIPDSAPATELSVVDAFPGLTFQRPVGLVSPPGDLNRLFVMEIAGQLKVIPDVSSPTPTASVVLDLPLIINGRTPAETVQGGVNQECGLLGVAFHPQFQTNGYFFVFYSVVKSGVSGFTQRVSRFTIPADQINSPNPVADPLSEWILIDQADQGPNHQGGDMHFGPDGYLYIAVGDEENPNDFRLNSQRIDRDFFSGMLRIDVDKLPGNLEPNHHPAVPKDELPGSPGTMVARYSVPADNPWVGSTSFHGQPVDPEAVRTEWFAIGLRSPWRFSIDSVTGEIWLGDVGQDRYEEVNVITAGGNYGWVFREGAHDINVTNAGWAPKPTGFSSIDPLYEYVHNNMAGDAAFKGNSVTGGLVYRGSRIPSLQGHYLFGDQVSGHLWSLVRDSGGQPVVNRIAGLPSVSSFGTDPSNGDVLMTYTRAGVSAADRYPIMRLVATTPDSSFPQQLSETGLFADLTDLSPSPGLLPYEPNLRFWSDHAEKRRWFAIPDPSAKMTWQREGAWHYPAGTLWVKHFDMEMVRGQPASRKRIETRLLVRTDDGAYGVSYRWNEAGTEASLVEDGGETFPLEIEVDGQATMQMWTIPGRAQCMVCHTDDAGYALSFNTRQLNRSWNIHDFSGNQIDLLHAAGYLDNNPDPTDTLEAHVRPTDTSQPLEKRVRSYLDVNCGYCHQPGGSGGGWDGRAELTLEQTGLIRGIVSAPKDPSDRMIVPGEVHHSVILSRLAETNGYTRMPPLASSVTDPEGIALLTEWILTELPSRGVYDDWALGYAGIGNREADDDGDGRSNYDEYLLGTNPLAKDSASGGTLDEGVFRFERRPFRIYDIESSNNLIDWESWNVPQNHRNYGNGLILEEIPLGPISDENGFFRLKVSEP
jgi:uncharacterized repeat protein (TIGR03806 family)